MRSVTTQKTDRRSAFARWWRKNHHRNKAHTWLAYNTRQVVFTHASPPEVFDHVQFISKRFFKSEHKTLSQNSAWFLWKISHPLHFERTARIATHAAFLQIQNEQYKLNKKGQGR